VHTGSIPVSTSKKDPARLAQRESASLTRKRSLVQSQYRAPQVRIHERVSSASAGLAPGVLNRFGAVIVAVVVVILIVVL
jgi:hypothetical protein